jgi:hypothetical protein
MSVKELTLKNVKNMPETVTFEEIYDMLYLMELEMRMKESEEDIKNGRTMSVEESREACLRELEEYYENRNNTKS